MTGKCNYNTFFKTGHIQIRSVKQEYFKYVDIHPKIWEVKTEE